MTVHLQRLFLPLVYVLVLVLLTYFIFLWRRSIKLEQEKQRLEQIIKERTRELEEKNQQLETQAARFLSNFSHEFRTPLTLIMLPLEHMLENCRDKEMEEGLNLMMENSLQLLTLINRLPHIFHRFLQEGGEVKGNQQLKTNDSTRGHN
ncbi:sensor histidine kinase [Acidobacteriota bacterium]